MSAKASVKLYRGLRYHESECSSVFVCCDVVLSFVCVTINFCWMPGDLRLRRRFICGLCRWLMMPYI